MSEREYKPNKLPRAFAAPLRVEDWEILYAQGPGMKIFYAHSDRRDAEIMFARCDSVAVKCGAKKEETTDRGGGCGNGPV